MMRFNDLPPVVKNMIILNVIVFLGTVMLPEHIKSMLSLYFFKSEHFKPFQIITSMFMHANVMHVAFNMISLYFLGPYVEQRIGSQRFLILYILSGLGATALHVGLNYYEYSSLIGGISESNIDMVRNEGLSVLRSGRNYTGTLGALNRVFNVPVLGASGAVYGVTIAFAAMFPKLKMIIFPIPIPVQAWILAIGMVAYGVFRGFGGASDGIAHFAHVGGAITGFLIVLIWGYVGGNKR